MGCNDQSFNDRLRTWKVFATDDVEEDLSEFVQYLLYEKMSEQAANAVIKDYDETLYELEKVAGSLKLVDNPRLAKLGYRRINFKRHRYYFLYRAEGEIAIVDAMYHVLQDPNNVMS